MLPYTVRLEDGRAAEIVEVWNEPEVFDGRNYVGRYTREEFRRADLGRSRTGAWVLLPSSSWQGEHPLARVISAEEAAAWFGACDLEVPEELRAALV